ncbi:MAG: ribosome biogenesis GTP-binding protein YihA/YsxC [Flavobacteriales bacterium AspAUS03]
MDIQTADFLKSSTQKSQFPILDLAEYAFIGRSNVGKSSLINLLTRRKNLAKTSSSPGKTQLINHFLINSQWYLTDLPGYGYAKISKEKKKDFQKKITDYILYRKNLTCLFTLIDSRLPPQNIDLTFIQWLGENRIPFCIVFTKTDKIGPTQCQKNIEHYRETLLKSWEEIPPYFKTSEHTRQGRTEILNYIDGLNQEYCAAKILLNSHPTN